jgi:hypothetical protein
MRSILLATAVGLTIFSGSPALAQQSRRPVVAQVPQARPPQPPSPAAQQAMQSGDQPDVLLDIPDLSVQQITLEVDNLQVHIALDARLANLLKLTAGADASIDKVKLDIKGVHAQATLIVRLDNVRAIIERTLQTLDNNPQILTQLLSSFDNTLNTVGGVANNTLGTVGGITSSLLRNGQVLDLARAGLTEVGRTVNAQGNVVHTARDASGMLIQVVTDRLGRIISSQSIRR